MSRWLRVPVHSTVARSLVPWLVWGSALLPPVGWILWAGALGAFVLWLPSQWWMSAQHRRAAVGAP